MSDGWVLAPAKVNLTLHVTGQRDDGYHVLDSLVMFADIGDRVRVTPAPQMGLTISGAFAGNIPDDARNLCWKAAEAFGETVQIELEKNLPAEAGIGGGSSDAAAVLRAMEATFGRAFAGDPIVLGADVPVCCVAHAARMQGIGEHVLPLSMKPIAAVLVNPGVAVSTPEVFRAMTHRNNPPMTDWPEGGGIPEALGWIASQRNDMEAAAIARQPVIAVALAEIQRCADVQVTRMSGSGATCFGLFPKHAAACKAATVLAEKHPGWWVRAVTLQ